MWFHICYDRTKSLHWKGASPQRQTLYLDKILGGPEERKSSFGFQSPFRKAPASARFKTRRASLCVCPGKGPKDAQSWLTTPWDSRRECVWYERKQNSARKEREKNRLFFTTKGSKQDEECCQKRSFFSFFCSCTKRIAIEKLFHPPLIWFFLDDSPQQLPDTLCLPLANFSTW